MNAPSDIKSYMLEVGRRARAASREVARAATATKNRALLAAARTMKRDAEKLLRVALHGSRCGEKRAVLGCRSRTRDLARGGAGAPADFEHVGLDVRGGVHPGNFTLCKRKASFPLLILRRGGAKRRGGVPSSPKRGGAKRRGGQVLPVDEANIGDPVTRSAGETRFNIFAFEVGGGPAKP